MTAIARVRRIRRRLMLVAAVRALGWAAAMLLGVLATGAALAALTPLPRAMLEALPWLAQLAALVTLALLGWRERFVASPERVALWIEERAPELRYALVTAVDARYAATLGPSLEPALAGVDAERFVRRAARRSIVPAFGALAAAGLVSLAAPPARMAASGSPAAVADPAAAAAMPSRLEPLRATLTPPPYAAEAGVPTQTLDEPTTIAGLAGSRIEITGPGSPDGVEARLAEAPVPVAAAKGDGWSAGFTLPDSAMVLRLTDRQYHRLIVLAPRRDQEPLVQLLRPARDTTVRTADGSLALDARIRDDLGLATAHFEYIISSGEGEGNFTFRQGTLGARALGNAREGRLRLTVPLRTFELRPGDRLSVRAVAVDNNAWNGPGTGYSETRTLRLARPSEYDSLAVEGAPPAVDSTLMTLRYLIKLTEELEQSREVLERPVFVDSSIVLGRRAERLRDRVQQLQADQTMGGLFERNPLLDTAYLALVQGAGALRVAEPGDALPYLWEALRVLTEYAKAERYYPQGPAPEVLVDLARVRLAGTDTGYAAVRTPRGAADTVRARLRIAYAEALARLRTAPDSAVERLLLVQVEALRMEPALAAALGEAVAALRGGRDASGPLQQARRILDGPAAVADTLPRWSGAW